MTDTPHEPSGHDTIGLSEPPPPLLTITGLKLQPEAAEPVSLVVKPGELISILGRAGAGGEELRNILLERMSVKDGVLKFGVSANGGRSRMAYLAGENAALSRHISTAAQLTRVLSRRQHIPGPSAREELRLHLEHLYGAPGLERLGFKPQTLKPRERALAFLALALAQNPDCVVADDPADSLDPLEHEEFLRILLEQHARAGFALLYFTGNPATAARLAGRIIVLRDGAIIEEGSAGRLASTHAHAYTQALFRAVPRLEAPKPVSTQRSEPLLQVRGFAFEKPKSKRADHTKTITFELRRGASLALVGARGSGRRSIARAVLGLERVAHGQIVFDSVDIGVLSATMRARLRRRIAFIDGNDAVLDPRMSVGDTVKEPMRAHVNLGSVENSRAMETVLKRVGLTEAQAHAKTGSLSALDRRRLQVARAISAGPQLLVLYEPLLHLDVLAQALILDLLKDYRARESVSFLLVTADFAVAQALCEHALVIRDRLVVESGPMAELVSTPADAYTAQLLRAKAAFHLSSSPPER